MWRRTLVLVAGTLARLAGPAQAADAPGLVELAEMRRAAGCVSGPTEDSARDLLFRGRPSVEIKGRAPGAEAGPADVLRDLAVVDLASGWIVSLICFTNASTRGSGEPIISLAEVSSRADKLARAIFPGAKIELESVSRHRADGVFHIYYEARYTPVSEEYPFLLPPVRLLLNASTGTLFRFDVTPGWLDPAGTPKALISRKAAERIASVFLRGRDLATAFGPGAVFASVSPGELFTVTTNDWQGFPPGGAPERTRVAWVVPFKVAGVDEGLHRLFVDAATGAIVGGVAGQSGVPAAR